MLNVAVLRDGVCIIVLSVVMLSVIMLNVAATEKAINFETGFICEENS
jgi:hypothetical protein